MLAAVLEGVELVGRFLPPLPLGVLSTLGGLTVVELESDWSACLRLAVEDSDWSDALRAAEEAILALAAALGEGVEDDFDVSLRKNKLPVGRSFVSSLRLKWPSLGGVVEEGAVSLVAAEDKVDSSAVGGEWNFTKESPYFSFC